ncbi:unnamed protein product [Boreogadus saida]
MRPEVDDTFGLMWKKNGTHEGEFVFYTGEQNYMDYGKIDTWNGLREMSWWSSNQSNMINGTDGALLYIFAADLCRSIHMGYVQDVEVKGIQAFRFAPPADVLMNPTDNPANQGFCVPAGDCLGTGVLKVSVCREGAPIVVSFPHFYQAAQVHQRCGGHGPPQGGPREPTSTWSRTTGADRRVRGRSSNVIVKRSKASRELNLTSYLPSDRTATIYDDSVCVLDADVLLSSNLVSNIPLPSSPWASSAAGSSFCPLWQEPQEKRRSPSPTAVVSANPCKPPLHLPVCVRQSSSRRADDTVRTMSLHAVSDKPRWRRSYAAARPPRARARLPAQRSARRSRRAPTESAPMSSCGGADVLMESRTALRRLCLTYQPAEDTDRVLSRRTFNDGARVSAFVPMVWDVRLGLSMSRFLTASEQTDVCPTTDCSPPVCLGSLSLVCLPPPLSSSRPPLCSSSLLSPSFSLQGEPAKLEGGAESPRHGSRAPLGSTPPCGTT